MKVTERMTLEVKCPYCQQDIELNLHTIRWSVWHLNQPIPTLEYDVAHVCPNLPSKP